MKERYLKTACVLTLACIVMVTLIGASKDPVTVEVKQLLMKRTDIMENVLSGNISLEEGKEQLRQIEKDKLYNDDIKNLIANMNCEHNKVIAMDITELNRSNKVSYLMTYQGDITWECLGINGLYTQNGSYIIGVDTSDDAMKLVSFEIVE